MSDPASGLNAEQLAAVTLPRQSALIRRCRFGQNRGADHAHCLAAANRPDQPAGRAGSDVYQQGGQEMLARLSAMLPLNTRGMWIGTFHGLCNRLLRTHHRAEAALPEAFQILDSADQLALIKRLKG